MDDAIDIIITIVLLLALSPLLAMLIATIRAKRDSSAKRSAR
jgi:hypothetical protein